MGKPLVRFREGQEIQPGYGGNIVAPPRKQVVTEKTNFFLQSRKAPVYSNRLSPSSNGGGPLISSSHRGLRQEISPLNHSIYFAGGFCGLQLNIVTADWLPRYCLPLHEIHHPPHFLQNRRKRRDSKGDFENKHTDLPIGCRTMRLC
jgi:hypothetical protein